MTGVPLQAHLAARRDAGRKLFVPYVTGGITDGWVDLVRRFADAGADAIEIGVPFSDPVMDGPTIQEASQRALDRGTTPRSILAELRGADVGVPLVVMTYANIVHQAGWERFAADLAGAGVTGAIVPDLPLEESRPWEAAAAANGVDTVLLAAPVTPDGRLAEIGRRTRGFLYAVTVMGVTGARTSFTDAAAILAKRCRAATDVPVLLGFGVSTPDQARDLAADADGVIVASALMRMVLDGAPVDDVVALVEAIRAGLG